MDRETVKTALLAAGRGTRMQADADVALTDAQRSAAERGLKPLIPIHGVPFVHHVLSALADAGVSDVCVVVRPGADPIRAHLERTRVRRLRLSFAVQDEPLGSAHALLAAADFAGGDDVLVINADNLYPIDAVRALRDTAGNALIGFRRAGLLRANITADRLAGYAMIAANDESRLTEIVEKPTSSELERRGADALFSMTCWRFTPAVFDACRSVTASARGEYELPDAVRSMIAAGAHIRVLPVDAPVLDLSRRTDIPHVEAALARTAADL